METIFDRYSDLFIDNEYFYQYRELCSKEPTGKQEELQKHHIIPKSYFRFINQPIYGGSDNIVKLTISDHILAHYLLYFCISDFYKPVKMASATMVFLNTHLNFRSKEVEEFKKLLSDADFDSLYQQARNSIGEKSKGKIYITDGSNTIRIDKSELPHYLSLGYRTGVKNKTVPIKKGDSTLYIKMDELQQYLDQGWSIGHTHKTSQKMFGGVRISKGDSEKVVPKDQLQEFLLDGWSVGRSNRSKNSIKAGWKPNKYCGTRGLMRGTTTGYVCVTDGVHHTRMPKDLVQQFLIDNPTWVLGMPKYKWMNNGKINVRVFSVQKENELVDSGYTFGMLKRVV